MLYYIYVYICNNICRLSDRNSYLKYLDLKVRNPPIFNQVMQFYWISNLTAGTVFSK